MNVWFNFVLSVSQLDFFRHVSLKRGSGCLIVVSYVFYNVSTMLRHCFIFCWKILYIPFFSVLSNFDLFSWRIYYNIPNKTKPSFRIIQCVSVVCLSRGRLIFESIKERFRICSFCLNKYVSFYYFICLPSVFHFHTFHIWTNRSTWYQRHYRKVSQNNGLLTLPHNHHSGCWFTVYNYIVQNRKQYSPASMLDRTLTQILLLNWILFVTFFRCKSVDRSIGLYRMKHSIFTI